jgi:hypothetical protein
MEKFSRYFAAFSGATDWSEVQAAFNDVFHPDLCVVTLEGELNKGQWEEMAKGLLARAQRRQTLKSPANRGIRCTTA